MGGYLLAMRDRSAAALNYRAQAFGHRPLDQEMDRDNNRNQASTRNAT
jgi:hypothetical protein